MALMVTTAIVVTTPPVLQYTGLAASDVPDDVDTAAATKEAETVLLTGRGTGGSSTELRVDADVKSCDDT